ncbi:hypothetical protein [Tessaracoccus oleiagri]|uniref:hypothetical protein n=1 Tax=Tessaracoccus oleiagri TaxID=686624 RepID=UPI00115F9AAE|nr:hypothetical protein [Tessaracoccus oleiagri]
MAENARYKVRSTAENGEEVIYSLAFLSRRLVVLLGGAAEGSGWCWIGVEVGVFPLSGELIDAIDSHSRSSFQRLHGALHDGQATLQLRHRVRGDELSVSSFQRVVRDLQTNASVLFNHAHWRRVAQLPIDADSPSWPAQLSISEQFTAQWKQILRRAGHRTDLNVGAEGRLGCEPATGHEVLAISRDGWFQSSAAPWPSPEFTSLSDCAALLGAVKTPEFSALRDSGGVVQACGAIGGLTYVMEDEANLERAFAVVVGNATSPSVFDLVARYFGVARKMNGPLRTESFSDSRWRRPLLVQASASEERIRVYTRIDSGEMVMDASISHAATALLKQPDSSEATGRLSLELDEWYTRALDRTQRE